MGPFSYKNEKKKKIMTQFVVGFSPSHITQAGRTGEVLFEFSGVELAVVNLLFFCPGEQEIQ